MLVRKHMERCAAEVTWAVTEQAWCLRQAWSQQLNQQSAQARQGAESWLTNFQANSKNFKLPKFTGMPVNVEVDVLRPMAKTVREAVAGTYLSLPLPVQVPRPAHACSRSAPDRSLRLDKCKLCNSHIPR